MITAKAFAGKRYVVLGLARSGTATVEALLASGAEVVAWDSDKARREAFLPHKGEGDHLKGGGGAPRASLRVSSREQPPVPLHQPAAGPPPHFGEEPVIADPLDMDLTGYDGVVVSPGVPLNRHPIAAHAAQFAVPLIGDIELFALARPELPPHRVVGITGTNGKSTTTALVHHILKTAGVPTTMGGNIGLPILAQEPLPEGGVYVLELSSYQIDLTHSLACDVAALLNVTPDHLDRYYGYADYLAAKIRLLAMQRQDGVAIVASGENGVAEAVMALDEGAELTQWFGGDYQTDFIHEQSGWPSLQGPHNAQNAWAARVICLALGVKRSCISSGLRSFPGLPHRMELVATHNGVLYINDSKATNQASAAPALAAYPPLNGRPRIQWIVGGQAKEPGLHELADWTHHCAVAYTFGEAGPAFAELLDASVPVERCGTLAEAVGRAAARAREDDVVLLSPACASFDQFRDFEERGEMFRHHVAQATGSTDSGEGRPSA